MDIFLDVETTGTNPYKHGVWQLAAIIYNDDGEEVENLELKMNILPDKGYDPKALKYLNITQKEIEEFSVTSSRGLTAFKEMLRRYVDPYDKSNKLHMYGYNVRFDSDFIRQWFYGNGDKYYGSWFFFPPIDIMNCAAEFLKSERNLLPNFKNGTVAKYLGIDVDEDQLHDALYDIRISREIYLRVS